MRGFAMLKSEFDLGITRNKPLHAFLTFNDRLQAALSSLLGAMLLLMACFTMLVVTLRYGFNLGTVALQEAIIYLHATVFLLGAGVALERDAHVRVDIFYQRFSHRNRDWVNAIGVITFLLPVSIMIGLSSLGYVSESWAIKEVSPESGGIPAVYLLKTVIPVSMVTLTLQGISLLISSADRLVRGGCDGR